MPEVRVNKQILGKRLKSRVLTEMGGCLYEKGTLITEQVLEFLEAFKIAFVDLEETQQKQSIEKRENHQKERNTGHPKNNTESFASMYQGAVQYMERLMHNVAGGAPIPVMEIRNWLKPLMEQVNRPTGWLMALQSVQKAEKYTYHHCVGVALLSSIIARSNRFAENEIMQISLAGLLSDIGKSKIHPEILWKRGNLTEKEFEEMKSHTILGFEMIKGTMGLSEGVALAALQHHERMDGTGYPLGLTGEAIHPYAKIVAIADVVHAMSSTRSYRNQESPFQVLEFIRYENVGRFDPGLVHSFISSITQFPLGTLIKLNDGRIGRMIYVDRNHPTRPVIDVDGEIISLLENKHLYIQEVLLYHS
jgi:HD-GYP domain-containing protein (c-di-GMP phosphodiesterase class II)